MIQNLNPTVKTFIIVIVFLPPTIRKSWNVIVDKSNNRKDACHDYIELDKPVKTKYIKIENVSVPDGKFSVYDLRIFGIRKGKSPGAITDFKVERR